MRKCINIRGDIVQNTCKIRKASEHNLKNIDVDFYDTVTAVTGVSGSGKTSLVFDTLYHESRRRFLQAFSNKQEVFAGKPARLGSISGLMPAAALSQDLLNRNPNSIIASASGLHPLLRILYTQFGSRSCSYCREKTTFLKNHDLLNIINNSILDSRITAVLLKNISGSHDTFLKEVSRDNILYVDKKRFNRSSRLDPVQTHTIEIQLADFINNKKNNADDIIAAAREMGAGSIRIHKNEKCSEYALLNICTSCGNPLPDLLPLHFNTPCFNCKGKGCEICNRTGLHKNAAYVTWQGMTLSELLELSVKDTAEIFNKLSSGNKASPADRLYLEINRILKRLIQVNLGFVSINRPCPSLSRGESQRLKIAVALMSELEDMLHLLDEPTIGQHPSDVQKLISLFTSMPGPVIFIEHDKLALSKAAQAVDIGPGSGHHGGELLYNDEAKGLWDLASPTGLFISGKKTITVSGIKKKFSKYLFFSGVKSRNLKNIDIKIPEEGFTVITGVSGSGKSTLVEEVILQSLLEKKPVNCVEMSSNLLRPIYITQDPIGKNARSNPATYTKCSDILRNIYADETGMSKSLFSFNTKEGACPECNGLGFNEIALRYMDVINIECTECSGKRFNRTAVSTRIKIADSEYSISDLYELEIEDLFSIFSKDTCTALKFKTKLLHYLEFFIHMGLGYLKLGQPSSTLSGGESQRIKLVKHLGRQRLKHELLLFDEPSTGLHPQDVGLLLKIFNKLLCNGATIICIEHNLDIVRYADWIIDLGPGAGPDGGNIVFQGKYSEIQQCAASLTGKMLSIEKDIKPGSLKKSLKKQNFIHIKNADCNNLKNIELKIPKNGLTVICGVSGSGKSSLVNDVIEVNAQKRFFESLTMYERQNIKEGRQQGNSSITGLGLTLSIEPERSLYNLRNTVGRITGIDRHLGILFSALGESSCPECSSILERKNSYLMCPQCSYKEEIYTPARFSSNTYGSACRTCHGIGSKYILNPEKLIIHPEKPLCSGAMYSPGFFPQGYLSKPFNKGYYVVEGLAKEFGFDRFNTPWQDMTKEQQDAFLFGTDREITVYYKNKKGHEYISKQEYEGFYSWIRDWDVGGTYTDTEVCPECGGSKFSKEILSVKICGHNIHQINNLPIYRLSDFITEFRKGLDLDALHLSENQKYTLQNNFENIIKKSNFLNSIGLYYMHLTRYTYTLSAGEAQRIKIASLLSNELNGITLLLDEPTRGMHPSEVSSLIDCLQSLTKLNNTLIVTEHEPEVIEAADTVIEMGPGSGIHGGEICYSGPGKKLKDASTITGVWLNNKNSYSIPSVRKTSTSPMLIVGASENNLDIRELEIPKDIMTGVCGVSGSGKSTLIIDTIARLIAPKKITTSVAHEDMAPGKYFSFKNLPAKALVIDQVKARVQSPLKFMNLKILLENAFAESDEFELSGLEKTIFSYRCKTCEGKAMLKYDMGFLPDEYTPCSECRGTAYRAEVLDLKIRGYTLPELFFKTVDEVSCIWDDNGPLHRAFSALKTAGLGYLKLDQQKISGGEAQRIKIAHHLLKKKAGEHTLFILDEPTVGLHMNDIKRLITTLKGLVKDGNGIIVVEHHPLLLASCDWLIELGPGGGPHGGRVIAQGTPSSFLNIDTPTAPYIKEVMEKYA